MVVSHAIRFKIGHPSYPTLEAYCSLKDWHIFGMFLDFVSKGLSFLYYYYEFIDVRVHFLICMPQSDDQLFVLHTFCSFFDLPF